MCRWCWLRQGMSAAGRMGKDIELLFRNTVLRIITATVSIPGKASLGCIMRPPNLGGFDVRSKLGRERRPLRHPSFQYHDLRKVGRYLLTQSPRCNVAPDRPLRLPHSRWLACKLLKAPRSCPLALAECRPRDLDGTEMCLVDAPHLKPSFFGSYPKDHMAFSPRLAGEPHIVAQCQTHYAALGVPVQGAQTTRPRPKHKVLSRHHTATCNSRIRNAFGRRISPTSRCLSPVLLGPDSCPTSGPTPLPMPCLLEQLMKVLVNC